MLLVTYTARAEEIAPYRITSTDGYATMHYLRDNYASDSGDRVNGSSRQQQGDLRTDVFFNGHGYVYHPNLLSLDIGGGPILERQDYSGNSGSISYTGEQYNLSLKAAMLKDKPYRGNLFFDHLNPTQSVAPGEVMTQENQRYGGDFSLLAPVSPVALNFAFSHAESNGSSSQRVVNDNADQYSLRASHSFGALGNSQVLYQSMSQSSVSGSKLLPLQASSNASQGLTVDSHLQWGTMIDLTQLFTANRRTYQAGALNVPTQSDMRLMLDLRYRPSRDLQEYVTADGSSNHQGRLDTTRQSLSGGLYYQPLSGMNIATGARAENTDSTSFASQTRSANGAVDYQHELWRGTLQSGYSLAVDWRSQQASSATAPILGEAATLSGTQYATLGNPHVDATSVVVSNLARTQIFIENADYILTVVGAEIRIQRLVGGAILDGEQVLLDYSYDVGGTYAYRQLDQNLSLGWTYGRYLSLSLHRLDSRPVLLSGQSSFPLNTVNSTVWSVRTEIPVFSLGWSIGGGIEQEHRQETLTPFQRSSTDAYVQNDEPLIGFGNLRLGTRRTKIDYQDAAQNVDLSGYDLRYSARPCFGWEVAATANRERDDGGVLPRKRLDATLSAQWHERKLSMTFSATRAHESQGSVQRTHDLLQWLLRRDF